jgi:hypothetical protein
MLSTNSQVLEALASQILDLKATTLTVNKVIQQYHYDEQNQVMYLSGYKIVEQ